MLTDGNNSKLGLDGWLALSGNESTSRLNDGIVKLRSMAPIVLFVYNRPWHTAQTIEALRKNPEASSSDLIIYADGVKKPEHARSVSEVRTYIESVKNLKSGFKSVQIVESDKNNGLSKSIIKGVSEVVSKYGKVIVLEDDLVVSPAFLSYMNKALDLFENVDQVASVHGYVYPISGLPQNFFLKGADCWGWGTWKRAWSTFEKDGVVLKNRLQGMEHEFDVKGSYPYVRMLQDDIDKKVDSWAIRWRASCFLKGMLTFYPGQSYVQNIGNDSSGKHSQTTDVFWHQNLNSNAEISIPEKIEQNEAALKKFGQFYMSIKPIHKRLIRKLQALLHSR